MYIMWYGYAQVIINFTAFLQALMAIATCHDQPMHNIHRHEHCTYMQSLPNIGVAVQSPAGPNVARAILINCSVDLPARAILTNMKQWNGKYGCLYCEEEGTTIGDDHLHRYWLYSES